MKKIVLLFIMLSVTLSAQDISKIMGELYKQKKFEELREIGLPELEKQPEDALINLLVGRSYVDESKSDEGKPYILSAIKYDKNNSWIKGWGIFYLAQIEFIAGDIENARKHLENCMAMNSTNNLTKSALGILLMTGLEKFYDDWEVIETENFRFKFQPNTLVKNPIKFADARENAFREINNFFNVKVPKKIDFVVWNSDQDALKINMRNLGVARPRYNVIHAKADSAPGHEITHILSFYLGNHKYKSRFINEGVSEAFNMDPANKLEIARGFKAKEDPDLKISIKKAWMDSYNYPHWVYYSLAGEFISRLKKQGGTDKLLKLISDQDFKNAEKLYGPTLNEIMTELEKEIN